MITDSELYSLAIFLGTMSMALIVGYHYLEANAEPEPELEPAATAVAAK
jgi:oligosaccharyl transferase complex subunit OST4